MSATKIYCLISTGKVPPCIEMAEGLKSTSKLKLTVISLLSFLSAHYYHILFLKSCFHSHYIEYKAWEERKVKLRFPKPQTIRNLEVCPSLAVISRQRVAVQGCAVLLCLCHVCLSVCPEWRPHSTEETLHTSGNGPSADGEEPVQGEADGAAGGCPMDWDDKVKKLF